MRQGVSVGVIAATVAFLIVACGRATPVTPTPSPLPTATPTPAPEPTPTPVPTPTPCDDCEPPVTNTNPTARLRLHLYTIENSDGTYTPNPDPAYPIPNASTARVDATAKDADERETTGQGPVDFFVSDPSLVSVTGNHTNQRRLRALRPGSVDVWAIQDGVRSNTLTLSFE